MTKSRIKINFMYNIVYQIVQMILPLITVPYITRVIGAEGVGIYSYTNSVAYYFTLAAMLGVNNYGNRSIASVRDDRIKRNETFSSIYLLQAITSLIAIVAYLIYICFIVKRNKIITILQLLYLISAILDINWLFFGLEEFKITVVSKVFVKIGTFVCIFIFIRDANDLAIYTFIMSISNIFTQIFMWFFVKKYVTFVKVPLINIKRHLKPTLVLFIPLIATSVYREMDKILLGNFSTMKEVGLYDNAEKIIMICLGVMSALGTVMLPKMSNLVASGKIKESKNYLIKSMQVAMFIGSAITFGIASIANEFAPLFFGKEFTQCGLIMTGLSITVLFIAWANVIRTQYLIPNSQDKTYIIAVFIGAIINVVTDLLLIRRMGSMGAVIGTIFAESSVAIYQTVVSRKNLDINIYLKNSIIFIFAGTVMYIVVRFVANQINISILSLLIEILVGAIIYLSITMYYFIKTKNSMIMNMLFEIFPNIKKHINIGIVK